MTDKDAYKTSSEIETLLKGVTTNSSVSKSDRDSVKVEDQGNKPHIKTTQSTHSQSQKSAH